MSEIYQAINRVMARVKFVKKKRGKDVSYTFAGEAALIKAIRPALVEEGIIVYPAEIVRADLSEYVTSRGTVMQHAVVVVRYRYVHISGEFFDVTVTGEAADVSDKAFNKAMTSALKYALRQPLLIETGDDPDESQPEGRAEQRQPVTRGRQPERPAAGPPPAAATPPVTTPDPAPGSNGMDDAVARDRARRQFHAIGMRLYANDELWKQARSTYAQRAKLPASSNDWPVEDMKKATDKLNAKMRTFHGDTDRLVDHLVLLAEMLEAEADDATYFVTSHPQANTDPAQTIKDWVTLIADLAIDRATGEILR